MNLGEDGIAWVAIEPELLANHCVVLPRRDIRGNERPLLLGRLLYMSSEAERDCFKAIRGRLRLTRHLIRRGLR